LPVRGGATTFTKADVFVKPKVRSATFFSYLGEDGQMDEGFTEHSGCPVLEGEKWITTFWMRKGVRYVLSCIVYLLSPLDFLPQVDEEHPWHIYNPGGKLLADLQED
jgi:hypothetical protein